MDKPLEYNRYASKKNNKAKNNLLNLRFMNFSIIKIVEISIIKPLLKSKETTDKIAVITSIVKIINSFFKPKAFFCYSLICNKTKLSNIS